MTSVGRITYRVLRCPVTFTLLHLVLSVSNRGCRLVLPRERLGISL